MILVIIIIIIIIRRTTTAIIGARHCKNNQDHDNIQEILQSDSIFKTPEQVETHDILSTLTSNCYNEQGQELNLQGHQQINIHPDFYYNKHNESIFDDERIFPCLPTTNDNEDLVKYDEFNPELINHATIKALIIQMTSPEVIDYSLICDFSLLIECLVIVMKL